MALIKTGAAYLDVEMLACKINKLKKKHFLLRFIGRGGGALMQCSSSFLTLSDKVTSPLLLQGNAHNLKSGDKREAGFLAGTASYVKKHREKMLENFDLGIFFKEF